MAANGPQWPQTPPCAAFILNCCRSNAFVGTRIARPQTAPDGPRWPPMTANGRQWPPMAPLRCVHPAELSPQRCLRRGAHRASADGPRWPPMAPLRCVHPELSPQRCLRRGRTLGGPPIKHCYQDAQCASPTTTQIFMLFRH